MIRHNINYKTNRNLTISASILYILLCSLFSINFNSLNSQSSINNSLNQIQTKELDTILHHYKTQRLAKIDTLLNITKSKTSLAWLNMLPSVNYDLDRNALNVGINFNSFATFSQQKQRNKIERLKLKESLENRLENDLLRLENDYLKLRSDIENTTSEVTNFSLYKELYTLKKDQYDNNKINLEVWLNFQKTYQSAYLNLNNRIANLEQRTIRFYSKIKSPVNETELNILDEISTKLKSFRHEQR